MYYAIYLLSLKLEAVTVTHSPFPFSFRGVSGQGGRGRDKAWVVLSRSPGGKVMCGGETWSKGVFPYILLRLCESVLSRDITSLSCLERVKKGSRT